MTNQTKPENHNGSNISNSRPQQMQPYSGAARDAVSNAPSNTLGGSSSDTSDAEPQLQERGIEFVGGVARYRPSPTVRSPWPREHHT